MCLKGMSLARDAERARNLRELDHRQVAHSALNSMNMYDLSTPASSDLVFQGASMYIDNAILVNLFSSQR